MTEDVKTLLRLQGTQVQHQPPPPSTYLQREALRGQDLRVIVSTKWIYVLKNIGTLPPVCYAKSEAEIIPK